MTLKTDCKVLDAKNNRLYYDALLKAPVGYTFKHAVTTTYSLDLEAILLVPIALFFSADFDFNAQQNRDDLIESLTKASDHISIFCQRGKIKVPTPYNKLIAFWEKGIHQVQMPQYDQSFHPKIWIIRYLPDEKKAPAFYRFLCTSRNLTASRDWDLAVSAEGYVESENNGENSGITEMLSWLDKQKGKVIPVDFFKELPKVKFDVPSPFTAIDFHPIGISPKRENPMIKEQIKQDERLVVSPFLKEDTLNRLLGKSHQLYLFSTNYELSQISSSFLQRIAPVFQFSPFIEDAEKLESMSESDEIPMGQNLHAKLFIDRKGRNITWYLGSANATKPASLGNIEFMVQLQTTNKAMGPTPIKEQFTESMQSGISLFGKYEGESTETDQSEIIREQEIRKLIHSLSGIEFKGKAEQNIEKLYDLTIFIPQSDIALPQGIEVKIKPLPEKQRASVKFDSNFSQEIKDFTGYEEVELSPYLIIEIWEKNKLQHQFVLDMKIELDSNRLNRIFTSIINSKSRFLNYLFFLMSAETPDMPDDEREVSRNKGGSYGDEIAFFANTPVYEKLMYTASRNSKKLSSINKLVERLKNEEYEHGEQIITKEFLTMWEVFHSFSQRK
jgi:hypothetical protein